MKAKVYSFFAERGIKRTLWANGLGRHSYEEFIGFMVADLKTISQFIGKSKYLLGDEICDEDFAIFGMLAQCLWSLVDSPYQELMLGKDGKMLLENLLKFFFNLGELSNLKDYCERMKERFWPDWEDHLMKNFHKKAAGVEFFIQVLSSS